MPTKTEECILSLDISSNCTGWSVFKEGYIYYGSFKLSKTDPFIKQLSSFKQELIKICEAYKPTKAVIEDVFAGANSQVVIFLAKLGGIAAITLYDLYNIDSYIVNTNTVKSFYSAKNKKQLFEHVVLILKLDYFVYVSYNDIVDSMAQLLFYGERVLNVFKVRTAVSYGFKFDLTFIKGIKEVSDVKIKCH